MARRFVIVDLAGASRDYFSQRQDAMDAIEELDSEHPGIAATLFVVTYGEHGNKLSVERGDALLSAQ